MGGGGVSMLCGVSPQVRLTGLVGDAKEKLRSILSDQFGQAEFVLFRIENSKRGSYFRSFEEELNKKRAQGGEQAKRGSSEAYCSSVY